MVELRRPLPTRPRGGGQLDPVVARGTPLEPELVADGAVWHDEPESFAGESEVLQSRLGSDQVSIPAVPDRLGGAQMDPDKPVLIDNRGVQHGSVLVTTTIDAEAGGG